MTDKRIVDRLEERIRRDMPLPVYCAKAVGPYRWTFLGYPFWARSFRELMAKDCRRSKEKMR